MIFGSLFSGVGGIDLGLERAGMECAWQVEIDDYCNRVLAKHWPRVPRFGDIREQHGRLSHIMEGDGYFGGCESCLEPVDLVSGGFPCQPHSVAGKRRGAEDDRNLWPEFRRVIAELRPRYVLAENVPGIVSTYIDTVLSDLEGEGYTCATFNLPAVAFDAPHRRERIFIVAHSGGERRQQISRSTYENERAHEGRATKEAHQPSSDGEGNRPGAVADATSKRSPRQGQHGGQGDKTPNEIGETNRIINGGQTTKSHWDIESNVGRVANGVPSRVDRLRGLGNAVVPQVAEWIGHKILQFADE